MALAQLRKRKEPTRGYDPLLERRIELLLPLLKRNGVRLVTNMGAANPVAAADAIVAIAKAQKTPIRVAVVTGDDVLAKIGKTADELKAYVAEHPELSEALYSVPKYKSVVGTAANFAVHVAEKMGASVPYHVEGH